ncbi:apolipoprotein N-acyltransferase [Fervidobacterium thailandense]|uniref:Apolipoprotein N-acyltransferase n=1 Tax=Fervidobacterium thailandense TaxID=1008305 RepID=A0A1E3G4W8_9BACT|nr:apolipoprotein N-acyltransferase [Fervidobacterium thailandense]ODN31297.1 apolipoprotein N-acyltransferase [Fervidobacterium thailandense]
MVENLLNVFLSAALLTLSMPGYLDGILAFVSLIGLFFALERGGPFSSAILSFLFFFTFTFLNFHFLIDVLTKGMPSLFGNFSPSAGFFVYLLFCILEALPFLIFGFLYSLWHEKIRFRFLQPLFVASLYTVSEFLRSVGDLGFTGGRISEGLYTYTGLIQILPLTGTLGLIFLIVVINYEFYRILKQGPNKSFVIIAMLCCILLLNNLIERVLPHHVGEKPIVVAQTDVPQSVKYSPDKAKLMDYLLGNFTEFEGYLTIFPEATFPDMDIRNTELEKKLIEKFKKSVLVIGYPTFEENKFYNSLHVYNHGTYVGRYDKILLFPFVETLPYPRIFGFLSFLRGVSYFTPGTLKTFAVDGYGNVGLQICFESYFPHLSRHMSEKADFIVVSTNDGWYRSKIALKQHFSQIVFRAVETRRDFVQVSNTGLSGLVDRYGKFTVLPYGTTWRILYVTPNKEVTFYTRFGDYMVIVSLSIVVLCALTAKRKRGMFV